MSIVGKPAKGSLSECYFLFLRHWETPYTDIFTNLVIYILMTFFLSILAATLPVPTGVLIPTFKVRTVQTLTAVPLLCIMSLRCERVLPFQVGAAFGRLMGEAMHEWYPAGLRFAADAAAVTYIAPGGYATVGAAAFSGAVTHTISISVIVFEMTGQVRQ